MSAFFKRQFSGEGTRAQREFDWILGVIFPVLCFAADPIFFKSWNAHEGAVYFGYAKPFTYILSYVSVMGMIAWLLWGKRLGWLLAPLAGLFVVGAFVSLLVGIVMLPFSLLGLLIAVGILGFTPLFSSFVFLRSGVRAYRSAKGYYPSAGLLARTLVLSAIFSFVVPLTVNFEIERLKASLLKPNSVNLGLTKTVLKLAAPISDFHSVAVDARRLPAGPERDALKEIYEELSGKRFNPHD